MSRDLPKFFLGGCCFLIFFFFCVSFVFSPWFSVCIGINIQGQQNWGGGVRLTVVINAPSDVWLMLCDLMLFLTWGPQLPFRFDLNFIEWKIIGHFTVKRNFELVISVGCKLLCDDGLCAALCRQTKGFLKARIKGEMHKHSRSFRIVFLYFKISSKMQKSLFSRN